MIKSVPRIAFRNLWKQKGISLINIIGLSMGIASSLIIALFVIYELSFDKFHENTGNIYKVYQHSMVEGEESRDAWTPVPIAAALKAECPEVKEVVRLAQTDDIQISSEENYFEIENGLYVDSSFFSIFSFDLVMGDKNKVLSEPRSIVLTETTARKIFGNENPVNKLIRFEADTGYFKVTGISQDPPENSHFDYNMLISMDGFWDHKSQFWLRSNVNTYVLLQEGIPAIQLEEKFPGLIDKYIGPQLHQVTGISLEDFTGKGN
ncbi:MAG TPA: ABC transporter permease, partial [Bacteroidales bacterium]|nr:ABC transporter permease [Bacteroidales bacterium]